MICMGVTFLIYSGNEKNHEYSHGVNIGRTSELNIDVDGIHFISKNIEKEITVVTSATIGNTSLRLNNTWPWMVIYLPDGYI